MIPNSIFLDDDDTSNLVVVVWNDDTQIDSSDDEQFSSVMDHVDDHVDEQLNFYLDTSLDNTSNDEDDVTVQSILSNSRDNSAKDGNQSHFIQEAYHPFDEMTLDETALYKIMML